MQLTETFAHPRQLYERSDPALPQPAGAGLILVRQSRILETSNVTFFYVQNVIKIRRGEPCS